MRGKAEVHTLDVFAEIVSVLYEVPTDPPEADLATDVVGKSEDFDETLSDEKVSVLFGALAPAVGEDPFVGLVIAIATAVDETKLGFRQYSRAFRRR